MITINIVLLVLCVYNIHDYYKRTRLLKEVEVKHMAWAVQYVECAQTKVAIFSGIGIILNATINELEGYFLIWMGLFLILFLSVFLSELKNEKLV